jgi:hypothetical protein
VKDEPVRFGAVVGAARIVRALCKTIKGLSPASSKRRCTSVTRDEIAALFAADLSRDNKRRP